MRLKRKAGKEDEEEVKRKEGREGRKARRVEGGEKLISLMGPGFSGSWSEFIWRTAKSV